MRRERDDFYDEEGRTKVYCEAGRKPTVNRSKIAHYRGPPQKRAKIRKNFFEG